MRGCARKGKHVPSRPLVLTARWAADRLRGNRPPPGEPWLKRKETNDDNERTVRCLLCEACKREETGSRSGFPRPRQGCGQLAGAYYGHSAIPRKWLESVKERDKTSGLRRKWRRIRIKSEKSARYCGLRMCLGFGGL